MKPSTQSCSLTDLIRAAAGGDVGAFGALVRRFSRVAIGYAHARVHDFHLAEDISQDAFLEAWLVLPRLKAPAAFPELLRRLVRKHADRRARRKAHRVTPLCGVQIRDRQESPQDILSTREEHARVLAAVDVLPGAARTALTLYYLSGQSIGEVASLLSVPQSTVKNRLHTARKQLQERMLSMVENAFASGTPEERFAARVQRALETFAAKGPAQGHMGSDWDKAIRSEMAELLRAPDGFEIALAMARSPLAAIRRQAATFFNLKDERRGLAALRVLLQDPAADVRRQALRAYAGMIFPGGSQKLHLNIFLRAPRVVPEVADLLPLTQDPHEKVRLYAVQLVGTYATLGDAKVDAAVAAALKDTSHKVQHSAARALGATCPGCGTAPAFARPTG